MAIDTKVLEQTLHLEEGVLENALKSDELVNLDLSGLKVLKANDFETLKANHEKALQEKQQYSNQVGREEALKLFVRELLPEGFEGRKDEAKVLEALKSEMSKGKQTGEPNKDIEELTKKLELHQKALQDKDNLIKQEQERFLGLENQIKREKDGYVFNSALEKEFEKYKDVSKYSKDDVIDLYKAKTGFEIKDGNIFLKNGENLINDEIGNPHSLENHFKDFMSSRVKTPRGGNGDKDYKFTKKMNAIDWQKSFTNQNPNATAKEITTALRDAISKEIVDPNA